jgi:hypothetical protein
MDTITVIGKVERTVQSLNTQTLMSKKGYWRIDDQQRMAEEVADSMRVQELGVRFQKTFLASSIQPNYDYRGNEGAGPHRSVSQRQSAGGLSRLVPLPG